MRRRRSRRARRRRIARWGVLLLGLAAAAVAAGAARDVLLVRSSLVSARSSLDVLRGEATRFAEPRERGLATAQIAAARGHLQDARDRLGRSVFLDVAGFAPGVSFQRSGLRQLVDDVDDVALAAGRLVDAVGPLQEPVAGEPTVPLARVAAFEEELRAAAGELRRVTRGRRGLWAPLAEGRQTFDEVTGPAATRLERAAETTGAFRTFFGEGGSRRYFVAGMNNAEMRDQGMILSFAIVRFEGGRLTVERTDPIEAVELATPAPVELPPGTATVFGGLLPTQQWRSINATADFPTSARTAVAMYEAATGQRLDGVIGVDVPALAEILAVTGPVEVAGFGAMTSDNVVPFLLAGQYEGMASGAPQRTRRDRVAEVADVVAGRLGNGGLDRVELGRRLAGAAAGRHVLLWSREDAETGAFARAGLTGALVTPVDDPEVPTFHLAVQDATGTKLDYLVHPRLQVDVQVTPGGTAIVRTKVTVENRAPVGAAPSYALGPNNASTTRPGQYVARVYLWGPVGSSVAGVAESGLEVVQQPLLVEPGATGAVEFESIVRDATADGVLRLRFVPQPRHAPMPFEVDVRRADGPTRTKTGDMGSSRTLTWTFP